MKSVIRGTSYILAHVPDMVIHNGTTQTTERIVNPEGEYLKELPKHLRSYEEVLKYYPNQVYIGNKTPEDLSKIEQPWYDKACEVTVRYGKFGQIMPQEEFILLMQICDAFELVKLDKAFVAAHREALAANEIADEALMSKLTEGVEAAEVEQLVNEEGAEPIYHQDQLVGCVKRAHDIDVNLSAHVMLENTAAKATSVLSLLYAVKNAGIAKEDVEYVIDCCEEACGDMNQRGGGNFAKAAAEVAGLSSASGSDVRGFCAGPAHAIVTAASLVAAGVYKTVIVTAGGCTAKLGMNGKDHVKKGLPILEDMLGGFSIVIGENDGVSPVFNLEMIGRHTVGTGSAPQAVISSLVTEPLAKCGLKVTDVDKFSPEMQNPDITKPAGAGDVPLANYKMIAALAIKRGDIEKADMMKFVAERGLTGWAPTQGHIPSGVPYLGFAREAMMAGEVKRVMIIGKGSLFLGRMTNLFDGISFVVEKNSGEAEKAGGIDEGEVKRMLAEAMRKFAESLQAEQEA